MFVVLVELVGNETKLIKDFYIFTEINSTVVVLFRNQPFNRPFTQSQIHSFISNDSNTQTNKSSKIPERPANFFAGTVSLVSLLF